MKRFRIIYLPCLSMALLFLSACTFGQKPPSNNSKSFYAALSPSKAQHKLYEPGDPDIPHPIGFYSSWADKPMYTYKNACGDCAFLYDPDTNELHYTIAYSQLSGVPIMMHFHLGGPTEEGPIIQTVFGEPYNDVKGLGDSPAAPLYGKRGPDSRAGFITGSYKLEGNPSFTPPLTAEGEVEKLMSGQVYVNIHTYLNEAGEIRGQIMPCNQ